MMKDFYFKFHRKVLLLVALLVATTITTGTASAEITLSLDRTDIHEHETFHLKVQVDDIDTLRQGVNLDFIPEGLTVRSRQEYNNSIIVNGQYSTQKGWNFELLAEKPGTYTIPALNIGTESSKSLTIRIMPEQNSLDDAQNSKIKLRAKVSDEEVYVQQQLIFTIRIYRSVVTRNQSITPIRVTNALVEKLGDNNSFNVVKNGKQFRVIEQRYAIFPQQSGDMVIEPMTYSATILKDTKGSSPWRRSQLVPLSLSTQKYTIKVKPKPKNAAEPWLPATKVELTANWIPKNQTFTVSNPANLDFIIKGIGLLKTQLPTVTFPKQDGMTIYRDSPQYRQRINHFGVNSYHFEKISVIPSKVGELTLPEIKVPWWNVETDTQEYAVLPAKTFHVEPSNAQMAQNNRQAIIPETQKKAIAQKTDQQQSSTTTQPNQLANNNKRLWQYISLALAIFWLLTMLWMLHRQKQLKTTQPARSDSGDHINGNVATTQSLQQAINFAAKNQAHKTAQALTNWLQHQEKVNISNLNQLIRYCHNTQQDELATELSQLEKCLYAPVNQNKRWKGKSLTNLLKRLKLNSSTAKNNALPELYDKRPKL